MKPCEFLIVGSGLTGEAALGGIPELDPDGSIGIIGLPIRNR